MKTIREQLEQTYDELNEHQFGQFDGLGGETIYIEPDEEAVRLMQKSRDMMEVMRLRQVGVASDNGTDQIFTDICVDWRMLMYHSMCPCPGVHREVWEDA